ncbi:hypothetical protein CROQUDRAFT_717292 [Cronartium quercuum f. sp. fusiforme G11]|uniref:Cytochrome b5 heme-binding domain-containing protein n=1 Tax=Cronartium quercuum f. sp. fusiforme G11 TaxID=708437 RepID=A0A9P6NAY2_9BASI|nr:hypothetical protein CROQUDRAFT_717292 [Cronartium quercuum f. sp. fusiforme G11]
MFHPKPKSLEHVELSKHWLVVPCIRQAYGVSLIIYAGTIHSARSESHADHHLVCVNAVEVLLSLVSSLILHYEQPLPRGQPQAGQHYHPYMFSFLGFNSTSKVSPDPLATNGLSNDSNRPSEDAPMFPAPNSIQRASGSASTMSQPTPSLQFSAPDEEDTSDDGEGSDDIPLDLDSLPPPMSTLVKPPVLRKKVKLQRGFSQLDWAKLKSSGANLRGEGVFTIRRITRDELSQHNKKDDAWSCFHGRVYNITPYLNYHPGGPRELMRVAGKDGTELFMKTHAWINADGMMDSCLYHSLKHITLAYHHHPNSPALESTIVTPIQLDAIVKALNASYCQTPEATHVTLIADYVTGTAFKTGHCVQIKLEHQHFHPALPGAVCATMSHLSI